MRTRNTLVTERSGVNYVRDIVERTGCLFKEVNLQHDFGHDGTILLVVDGEVQPHEIAVQVKSGASYLSATECSIPASEGHLKFWAGHDLQTIGIVFDPIARTGWWCDLTLLSKELRQRSPRGGATVRYSRSAWNEFTEPDFASILLPTLLREAPRVPLERAISWVKSPDLETHDLGVRVICARHRAEAKTWRCLLDEFARRSAVEMTFGLPIALSRLLFHDDLGYYDSEIPLEVRRDAIKRVFAFGPNEIAKILEKLVGEDFERPSVGYSLLPILGHRADSTVILSRIRDSEAFDPSVRNLAGQLYAWSVQDPHWWSFWRREKMLEEGRR